MLLQSNLIEKNMDEKNEKLKEYAQNRYHSKNNKEKAKTIS